MNDALLSEVTQSPLQKLLDEHFSPPALADLLGPACAKVGPRLWDRALAGPVASFIERPGKVFRASLVAASYALAGGRGVCPERLSALVEILHAGSLIIDDIEDESSSRRGGPALHHSHGVPVALNAGNWMYFWALGLIDQLNLDARATLDVYRAAHRTLLACHHGQGLDLTVNVLGVEPAELPRVVLAISELKTGALMELSTALGAIGAGAHGELAAELPRFGRRVGVALQMLDDVGGLVSEKRCHKGHEDLLLGRPTWPWAWLAPELPRERYQELLALSREVQQRSEHPERLARALRRHLRGSGRVRIRRYLHETFAPLEPLVRSPEALAALRGELARMEKSYG